MELPSVLRFLHSNGADNDYQVVGSSEDGGPADAFGGEQDAFFGQEDDDDDDQGVVVRRGIPRSSVISPQRRIVELLGAFATGCVVMLLLTTSANGGGSANGGHTPPLVNDSNNNNDINPPKKSKPQHDDGPDKIQKDEPPTLPLAEREKFMLGAKDYDMAALQAPKKTPSGWWPDELWIYDCANRERDLTPFNTNPDWVDYRLGDCVKLCSGCPDKQHPHLMHNATIAGQYWDLGCDKQGPHWHVKRGNETLLNDIIDGMTGRPGFVKPDPDAIVIHLRLGDKMEHSSSNVQDMLQKSADPGFRSFQGVHAIKSLYEFMSDVVRSGADRVVIRGGSQTPTEYVKSKTYAHCLREAFQEAGYDTTIDLEEGDADIDFYFMVNARRIITSLGGFSRYIGHLVLQRGGITYGVRKKQITSEGGFGLC